MVEGERSLEHARLRPRLDVVIGTDGWNRPSAIT